MGRKHYLYAAGANNLAALYFAMGDYEKAEPLYLAARDICSRVYGTNHPDYLSATKNLAKLYHVLGRPDKAIQIRTTGKGEKTVETSEKDKAE